MCIVPFPIQSISKTNLFVMPSLNGTRQMTMYGNTVKTYDENLMILPIPNIHTLQLHDLSYRKKIFDDLRKSVIRQRELLQMAMRHSIIAAASLSNETLPVFHYGSYQVSIASKLSDLCLLDTNIFDLPPGLITFLQTKYNSEFGYLCCRLRKSIDTYEPVCYSHALHSSGKLFVPTVHYHVHTNGSIDTDSADWDHYIYSLGTTPQANLGFNSAEKNVVDWSQFPTEFQWSAKDKVRCAEMKGKHPNIDLVFIRELNEHNRSVHITSYKEMSLIDL